MQGLGSAYLLESFEDEAAGSLPRTGNVADADFMHWLGYEYAWWQRVFRDSSARIVQMAPFALMEAGYPALHCLDPTQVAAEFRERSGLAKPPAEIRRLVE